MASHGENVEACAALCAGISGGSDPAGPHEREIASSDCRGSGHDQRNVALMSQAGGSGRRQAAGRAHERRAGRAAAAATGKSDRTRSAGDRTKSRGLLLSGDRRDPVRVYAFVEREKATHPVRRIRCLPRAGSGRWRGASRPRNVNSWRSTASAPTLRRGQRFLSGWKSCTIGSDAIRRWGMWRPWSMNNWSPRRRLVPHEVNRPRNWGHSRLTNLRLLLQLFVCACLLLPWLRLYPLPHLSAGLADLCALMITYHPLLPH